MGIFSFVENIELLQAILLTLGLVMLLVEVFAPGFGVAGITGIILFVVGIILTAETIVEALIMFLILLFVMAIVIMFVIRSATKGRLSRKLVLKESISKKKGFSGVEDMNVFLNKKGKALTMLRPAGIGQFDGVRLDVVTSGAYIEEEAKIKITEVIGRRIVVERIESEEE